MLAAMAQRMRHDSFEFSCPSVVNVDVIVSSDLDLQSILRSLKKMRHLHLAILTEKAS